MPTRSVPTAASSALMATSVPPGSECRGVTASPGHECRGTSAHFVPGNHCARPVAWSVLGHILCQIPVTPPGGRPKGVAGFKRHPLQESTPPAAPVRSQDARNERTRHLPSFNGYRAVPGGAGPLAAGAGAVIERRESDERTWPMREGGVGVPHPCHDPTLSRLSRCAGSGRPSDGRPYSRRSAAAPPPRCSEECPEPT